MVQWIIHKLSWEGLVDVPGEVAGMFATGSVSSESLSSDCFHTEASTAGDYLYIKE